MDLEYRQPIDHRHPGRGTFEQHQIVTTFKSLYPARWLATGISKGGMTAVYHDRFYPGDYSGTLAYSSPNDITHHARAQESARQYVPRSIPMRFDPRVMPDIDRWVRNHGDHLIFTYGGVDPYGATPFRLGPGTRDSAVYVKPDGDHLTTIARFGVEQQTAIIATLRRWAGVPATTAATSQTTASAGGLPRQAVLRP